MKIINSTVRDIVAAVDGGAVYSENDVKVIGSNISHCSALNGKGGAIYSVACHPETTINTHSEPNVVFLGVISTTIELLVEEHCMSVVITTIIWNSVLAPSLLMRQ